MGENSTYKTGQLAEILGVSRDALRYYEEQGIIKPKQKAENNYREYDFYDIYRLMVTDFYKKRNLSIKEVKELQSGSEIDELEALLTYKAEELEKTIRANQYTLQKIEETKEFCKDIYKHLNQYSLRPFPTSEIRGEISDFDALGEYPALLENMDLMKDDILSKITRKFTFDESGFLGFKLLIFQKCESEQKENGRTYIEHPTCIYTIVEDGKDQVEDAKVKAFNSGLVWAAEHRFELQGVAYANTRLITYREHKERIFIEIYIPVTQK